jgi:hypothetical protein
MNIKSTLDKYPKVRPPLPPEFQDIYASQYKANRDGNTPASSLSKTVETWLHKQVASDVSNSENARKTTLEIGAGTLNQLEYEPLIEIYDIVEPFAKLYENSPAINRIRNIYSDISDTPKSNRYERITSSATLEHICNLPEVIARAGLLLAENGTFRASIPNEGSLLWKACWKMTTGLEFKLRYGLDYEILMRHEHVNTAEEIFNVLSYFFSKVNCRVFGISKSISVYHFYECLEPIHNRCLGFIEN